jgi:hypothetical protein
MIGGSIGLVALGGNTQTVVLIVIGIIAGLLGVVAENASAM